MYRPARAAAGWPSGCAEHVHVWYNFPARPSKSSTSNRGHGSPVTTRECRSAITGAPRTYERPKVLKLRHAYMQCVAYSAIDIDTAAVTYDAS